MVDSFVHPPHGRFKRSLMPDKWYGGIQGVMVRIQRESARKWSVYRTRDNLRLCTDTTRRDAINEAASILPKEARHG